MRQIYELPNRIQEKVQQINRSGIGTYIRGEIIRDTAVCTVGGAILGGLLHLYFNGDNISLNNLLNDVGYGALVGGGSNLLGETILQLSRYTGRFAGWLNNLREKE